MNRRLRPAPTIVCVECGGRAHLLTKLAPDADLAPGDVVLYRCSDCLDRWDVVVSEDDVEPEPDPRL